ncbi:MAG: NUDIX domain-containing protein [Pseudomonadota bacterium]
MRDLFFFGTLCDLELLEIVAGHAVPDGRLVPAKLHGWAVYWASGADHPTIIAETGGFAEGLVMRGVSAEEEARFDYYEHGHDFRLATMTVETEGGPLAAEVYFPPEGAYAPGARWRLDNWQARCGLVTRTAAREVMGYMGQHSAEWAGARRHLMLARAEAVARAGQPRPRQLGTAMSSTEVDLHKASVLHADFFRLDGVELSHRRYDGGRSEVLKRAVFCGFDAALCIPYDPVRDRVLLVEQFRVGAAWRGDAYPWLIEPVAGLIDAGETPEEAAIRETREEAGITLKKLHDAGRGYASPGANTAYFFNYVGLCDLPDASDGRGGLADEGEDIRTIVLSFERFHAFLREGEANVMPLLQIGYWLMAHRAALMAEARQNLPGGG